MCSLEDYPAWFLIATEVHSRRSELVKISVTPRILAFHLEASDASLMNL